MQLILFFFVQLFQQIEALWRDDAENPSPVLRARRARNQAFALQSIDETGDSRRLLDHPLTNRQGRYPLGSGPAQNSQHVVLLWGDAVGFNHLSQTSLDRVSCAEKPESCFLFSRVEHVGRLLTRRHGVSLLIHLTLSKQMVTLAAKRVQAAIFWLLSRGSSALDLSDPGDGPFPRLTCINPGICIS